MREESDIRSTLARLVQLLRQEHGGPWAAALAGIAEALEQDPRSALSELLRCYGGSGSFNDLMLNGVPVSVNQQLDQLRQRLFEQAVAMLAATPAEAGAEDEYAL